jgi:NTP pyrophosphatase (non-canonical NTP hydrolase)
MSRYTVEAAQEFIAIFLEDKTTQKKLMESLDLFAELCAAGAAARGFHEDENEARILLDEGARARDTDLDHTTELAEWFDNQLLQAEIGRLMSEGGEMIEAVRKPGPDHHLPSYSNVEVEAADILIRLGDIVGKRGWRLGLVTISKLLYNASRPYKHGKNS